MLTGFASSLNPLAGRATKALLQTYGGKLQSQDPYAADVRYLGALFGSDVLAPSPRDDIHYMTQFTSTSQLTLTSSSSGTLSVVIVPQSVFQPSYTYSTTMANYPFVTPNSVNPLTPFTNAANVLWGPFAATTTTTQDVDICNVRFLNTMNDLTSSGKMISSVYYQPPDPTWDLPVTTANASFSSTSLLNNIGYTRQYTMCQLKKGTTIARYVQDQANPLWTNQYGGLIPC